MKIRTLLSCAIFSASVCASSAAFAGDYYVLGAAGTTSVDGASSSGAAFKLQLGYFINPNVAIEGGYVDAGTQKYNFGSTNVEAKTTGGSIAVLGIVPLGEQFSFFGKLGYNSYTSSVTGFGSGSTSGSLYGLGGMFKITDSLSLRLEYEKVASDTALTTFGVQYKF